MNFYLLLYLFGVVFSLGITTGLYHGDEDEDENLDHNDQSTLIAVLASLAWPIVCILFLVAGWKWRKNNPDFDDDAD